MQPINWGDFLPGTLTVSQGDAHDYAELERFHYVARRPATWAGVWVVRYADAEFPDPATRAAPGAPAAGPPPRVVAVAVLSYPTVNCAARDAALGLAAHDRARKLRWVNANVRTISRVVVHPQFRGVGLAGRLVRRVCEQAPTRWVEALAAMGRVNPFFERGGMRRAGEGRRGVIYYLADRGQLDAPR